MNRFVFSDSTWTSRRMGRKLAIGFLIFAGFLFLPWVQNLQVQGTVIALRPEHRPQRVQTLIAGKIESWRVKEGDWVHQGDTLAILGEVKSEYLDPGLIDQTGLQIEAKETSLLSYGSKILAINNQIRQMEISRDQSVEKAAAKIEQERMKIQAAQAELDALMIAEKIAYQQFQRDSILALRNLKSPLELENRRVKWQETIAKQLSKRADLNIAENGLRMANLERGNLQAEYAEKLSKLEGDRFTAISSQMETEADISKLRNTLSNYEIRNGFYTITAPQDGYITQTLASGLGENLKEGEILCTIVPGSADLGAELFLSPTDMPLVDTGVFLMCAFDGWPTLVFSGWPDLSSGTFKAVVYGQDNMPSENGLYRILVKPAGDRLWPKGLKVGVGVRSYMLLKRVPLWYELWRQLNGFPADFYHNKRIKPQSNEKK
ncbi:MAG: HlyD family secretion protein [Bacteroidia bacterium]